MIAIIEIQKDENSATNITELFTDISQAKSRYHQILAVAAISSVPEHSVILVSEEGNFMLHEKYIHEIEEEES